ncbi:MAG: helix-turn-helix domain-containing protein [Betaproteobacteria bacterium]|nr:helix-turn-helix domain-containing protein [Betaproteobacteria bacterium]
MAHELSDVTSQHATAGMSGVFCHVDTSDAEEQAALLRGWNQVYSQMSPGTFSGAISEAQFGNTLLFIESTSNALLQSGAVDANFLAVGVPLEMAGAAVFCGAEDSRSAVHVFSGSSGFEFFSPSGLVMAGLVVSWDSLHSMLSDQEWELLCSGMDDAHLMQAHDQRVTSLRAFVCGVFKMLEHSPQLLGNAPLRLALENAVLSNLAELLIDESKLPPPRIAPSSRWKIVAAAREVVRERADSPISVAEICLATGVSRRTLQYCFQDVLGLSPAEFLRAVRLNTVRRTLRSATSVTMAAASCGFWHFGRFAGDYQRMFGELPSETFRRRQTRLSSACMR